MKLVVLSNERGSSTVLSSPPVEAARSACEAVEQASFNCHPKDRLVKSLQYELRNGMGRALARIGSSASAEQQESKRLNLRGLRLPTTEIAQVNRR